MRYTSDVTLDQHNHITLKKSSVNETGRNKKLC